MHAVTFRAMGTDVDMVVEDVGARTTRALADARAEVRRLEGLLSRFLPDSDVSRLNRQRCATVSPDTIRVVGAALSGRALTAGRFDPTMCDGMVAAGYDRELARLPADHPQAPGPPRRGGGVVDVDVAAGRVTLHPGASLDLGGIAKGYAADRACAILADAGGGLVGIGGDIAVAGPRDDGTGWPVAVGDDGLVLSLRGGGVATSGVDRRCWRRAGRLMHHILDPATGEPARTDLLRVTVAAASAADAEVHATDLLLSGSRTASARADELGVAAVLVTSDGCVVRAGLLRPRHRRVRRGVR